MSAAVEHLWDRQLVLVTGKGGVGKTTVAASLAKAAHAAGKRVLIAEVSQDVSTQSTLLSHFGHPAAKGEEPIIIDDRLYGVRITPSAGHKLFLTAALRVKMLVNTAMRSAALRRFLMAAPAFPELGTLYHLVTLLRKKAYDHIILDLPATGHALGLASLPAVVLRIVSAGLIGDAIREGLDAMTDPERGGAVIVTLPEGMPVTEALELADGLKKLDIPVRAMVLNQMPSDLFTEEEHLLLDQHIRANQDALLLGTRELRRLERAVAAQKTFRGTVPQEIKQVEVSLLRSDEQRTIVEHVTKALDLIDIRATAEAAT